MRTPGFQAWLDSLLQGCKLLVRCEARSPQVTSLVALHQSRGVAMVQSQPSPQVISLVALRRSRGVAMVQIWPSPQVISLVALRRSRGVAMVRIWPSPQVIYFWAVLAGCLCLSCDVQQTLFGPFWLFWELKLCERYFFLNQMLNWILRASKLCGRHISLEPDCKPDIWELQWDWLSLSRILNRNPF